MYLTNQDQKILQFVEEFGSITINQCSNMFFNTQTQGYEMSRRHLKKLSNYKKIEITRDAYCNRNVYHMGKIPSYHTILILDYYTELIKNGAHIVYFKREQSWLNKSYFSDGYCCYKIGEKVIFDIIEVIRTKNIETDKYIDIYKSGEAHELCDDIYRKLGGAKRELFPHLIIIDDVRHKKDLYVNDDIKVIQLDFKLSDFSKLFM